MPEKNVLISITNMKKYFPLKKKNPFQRERLYVKANDGISIDIYQGETFGLVGESGCGKSTLGRVLLQLHSQTDGHTMYYGRTRGELAPKYVEKLLRNIHKPIAQQKKLDAARNALQAQYDAAKTDNERWALADKLADANKAADGLYADIVKILGGFITLSDPSQAAQVLLEEHHASMRVARDNLALGRVTVERDAMLALSRDDNAKPAQRKKAAAALPGLDAQLHKLQASLAASTQALGQQSARVEEMRAQYRGDTAFDQNELLLDSGIDLSQLRVSEMRHLRKDMQLIFQDPYSSLNPRMTVSQLIGEGLLAHNMHHKNSPQMQEYVLEIMDKCGLAPYMMHRYPHQFSGGQRQRIGIARSLALQPKFVVCDEAVSALDVSIQSQILNLLLDLKEQDNLTYLFISHDLSVVKYISDRIGVMYLGAMVELATSQRLFKNPLHPYTEALLAAIPTTDVDAPRDLIPIEGDIPSPIKPPSGCKFHTRCKYASEICRQVTPEYRQVEPGHFVACHLRNEL